MRIPKLGTLSCVLLSILVILFCAYEIKNYLAEDQLASEELRQVQSQIDELKKQKDSVDQQIAEINQLIHPDDSSVAKVMICFEGVTDRLYEELYPVMEQAGLTGTMVFKSRIFPGDDGCITTEHTRELYQNGWNIAVSAGDDISVTDDAENDCYYLQDYLSNYIDQMNNYGLICDSVYFNEGMYREEYSDTLDALDSDIAFINDSIVSDDNNHFTYVQLSDLESLSQKAEAASGTSYFAVIFKVDDESETYSADSLSSMISSLKNAQDTGLCQIINPSDITANKLDSKELNSYNKKLEELQKQSEDFQNQIDAIYKN